jgi:predicted transcriptional regulator
MVKENEHRSRQARLFYMELHLTPEASAKLNDLARRTHRGTDELLGQAVDHLVAYNEWFERKVRNSMAAAKGNQAVRDEETGIDFIVVEPPKS